MEQFAKETIPVSLEAEMRHSYLDYAMSVIVGRALPDVRDGLKPVHRRVLFAMHETNNVWNRPYVKCARVVGEVMGKYHPHGDMAIYDTLVRMAQDFSLRYPMIDGQGNFGSVDGDNAAAMRYTECRLQKIANELLADIDKETVDFVPNYDGKEQEPAVLPSRLPNLLVNGSSGIAVGLATNIPPHNLTEVLGAGLAGLGRPDIGIAEIVQNNLFKLTQLQDSFGMNMVALVDGAPRLLNLKQFLELFLQHRREVVVRRTRFELRRARERGHILEGLAVALSNVDEIIALIKAAPTPAEAKSVLMAKTWRSPLVEDML